MGSRCPLEIPNLFSLNLFCKYRLMGQCSMCWGPGASGLLRCRPASSPPQGNRYWATHSPAPHSPTGPFLSCPCDCCCPSPSGSLGVGAEKVRVESARSWGGDLATCEDLHDIPQIIQNSTTCQKSGCGRKEQKSSPPPVVFSTCMAEKATDSQCVAPTPVLLQFPFSLGF